MSAQHQVGASAGMGAFPGWVLGSSTVLHIWGELIGAGLLGWCIIDAELLWCVCKISREVAMRL